MASTASTPPSGLPRDLHASASESLVQHFQDLTLDDRVSELRAELGEQLKAIYHDDRHTEFARQTHFIWGGRRGLMFTLESTWPRVPHSSKLADFCNKPTMFYWAHSAQDCDRTPLLIFGCIYKEWFRHHHPSIELGHFFANPIRITSTGPTTISGILEAHRSLCDQISLLLGKIERGEVGKPYMSVWPNTQKFKLLPLCRAIIVILDKLSPDEEVDPDGLIRLDEDMQRESVILVLTGDDSGLSTSVTFESLRAQSLPLARPDYIASNDGIDAIRVSLASAVGFIADLELKEEAAHHGTGASTVDGSICPPAIHNGPNIVGAVEWANEIIKEAVEKGKENVYETRKALDMIQAAQRGEDPFGPDLPPGDGRWI